MALNFRNSHEISSVHSKSYWQKADWKHPPPPSSPHIRVSKGLFISGKFKVRGIGEVTPSKWGPEARRHLQQDMVARSFNWEVLPGDKLINWKTDHHVLLKVSCCLRSLIGKGNYADYDSNVKISFSLKKFCPPPPPESFAQENSEGAPLKNFWLRPPWKNPRRKPECYILWQN